MGRTTKDFAECYQRVIVRILGEVQYEGVSGRFEMNNYRKQDAIETACWILGIGLLSITFVVGLFVWLS